MIRIERATEEHARAIAPRLSIFGCSEEKSREGEVAANHVRASTEAWTWLDGDTPLAMAGVLPRNLIAGVGAVWLLTTPEAHRHRRAFWLASKALVAYLRHEYSRIEGHVDVNFETSQRWLTKLGFHIVDAPYNFEGRRFTPFVMER